MKQMVQVESNIAGCPLPQYLRRKEGATISKDQRHITKWCTRKMCCRPALQVAGVAISTTLLIGLAARLRTTKEIGAAAKETNFMSVPNAFGITRALSDIAEVDHGGLDPYRFGQASVVKEL